MMADNLEDINKHVDPRDQITDDILGGLSSTLGRPVDPEHQLIRSDFHLFGDKILGQKDMPFHTQMRDVITSNRRGIFLLPRGFGKCVRGDTLVNMASGDIKPISDVECGEYVFGLDSNLRIQGGKISSKVYVGVKEAIEIIDDQGSKLVTSPDHRIYTEFGWAKVAGLKVGDWIATARQTPLWVRPNNEITDDELKLLGYWISEGTSKKGNYEVTTYDPIHQQELADIAIRGGWKTRCISKGRISFCGGSGKSIPKKHIYANRSWSLIRRFGLDKTASSTKYIPHELLKLSNSKVALFLSRLYGGDGWVEFRKLKNGKTRRGIGYVTTSLLLARQLKLVLLRFNIQSALHCKVQDYKGSPYKSYCVMVNNIPSILRFHEKIGVFGKKGELLQNLVDEINNDKNWNLYCHYDRIPGIWRKYNTVPELRLRENGIRVDTHKYAITRNKLLTVGKFLGNDSIIQIATSDIKWEKIKHISTTDPCEMYDITVDDVNSFIANGIISHNSNVMSVQLPSFILGNNRDARIIIATNALRLGIEWLREIENIMATNAKYREVFGNLIPEARTSTWTDTEKIVAGRSPNATHTSLYVVSSTGSTLGKRASHILVDDIFEPEMGLPSESQIRRVKEWFWKVLFPVLDPDGCIFVAGTRFHALDLYGELLDRGWPHMVQQAIITNPATGKEESAWPDRFSLEELQSRRSSMGSIIFNLQYQNNADISSRLQLEYLHLIPEDEIPKDLVIYQGVDPCLAVGANPDYFCIATIGVSEKTGKGYLLDLVRARVDFAQQIEIIMQQAAQWNPRKIGVETNAAQVYMKETLQDAASSPSPTIRRLKKHLNLPIIPLPSKSSKQNRILAMSAMFESGLIAIKAQKDGGSLVPIPSLEPFVSEWLMFPAGKNDDSLDGVEKACRVAEFGLPKPIDMVKEPDLPYYRRRSRLTLFHE